MCEMARRKRKRSQGGTTPASTKKWGWRKKNGETMMPSASDMYTKRANTKTWIQMRCKQWHTLQRRWVIGKPKGAKHQSHDDPLFMAYRYAIFLRMKRTVQGERMTNVTTPRGRHTAQNVRQQEWEHSTNMLHERHYATRHSTNPQTMYHKSEEHAKESSQENSERGKATTQKHAGGVTTRARTSSDKYMNITWKTNPTARAPCNKQKDTVPRKK